MEACIIDGASTVDTEQGADNKIILELIAALNVCHACPVSQCYESASCHQHSSNSKSTIEPGTHGLRGLYCSVTVMLTSANPTPSSLHSASEDSIKCTPCHFN